MGGATRRVALVAMLVAVAMLALLLGTQNSETRADVEEPGNELPSDSEPVPPPSAAPVPTSLAIAAADNSLVIDRLWSPAPHVARAEGTTSSARMLVSVEANDRAMPPVTLDADSDGRFSVDIRGLEPGAQEVCIATACQLVLVAAP